VPQFASVICTEQPVDPAHPNTEPGHASAAPGAGQFVPKLAVAAAMVPAVHDTTHEGPSFEEDCTPS
jgi:hypothetical protein